MATVTIKVCTILTQGTMSVPSVQEEQRLIHRMCELEGPYERDPSVKLMKQLPGLLAQNEFANEIRSGLDHPSTFKPRKGFVNNELQH